MKIIIGTLVAVLLIGTGGYFVLNSDSEKDNSSSETSRAASDSEAPSSDADSTEETPIFQPIPTTAQSFIVDIETEGSGSTFTGRISYDESGNSLFEGTFDNDQLRFYDIDGRFISCQTDVCFALPDGQNGVDRSTYEYNDDDIASYGESAVYGGTADCPAGTCDAWRVTNEGADFTLYIASDGRISKAEGTSDGSTFTAVFSYEPVTIIAPENVQAYPLQ